VAQQVHYRKPRLINPVSVIVVLLLLAGGYAAYQLIPSYFARQEAYRVLEEHSSQFAGRKARYLTHREELDALRRKMEGELRRVGVSDPEMESWIEVEGESAHFGVVYSDAFVWPFGVLPPSERTYELEYTLDIR
jgi:hypothetical protein